MIEEDGIFSVGNDVGDSSTWNRDLVWRVASRIPIEYLFWEASDLASSVWLINSFGPDVNLIGGDEWLGGLAAFRAGAFYTRVASFRDSSAIEKK